jgi:UDP-glucose 4-epimerase
MSILITGGAGFIGSHTAVEFLEAGYDIVVVDNYYNSSPRALERIEAITGKKFRSYEVDLCDKDALEKVFIENLSQTNKTFLNNEEISSETPTAVNNGDEIGLGGKVINGTRQENAAYFVFQVKA